MASRADSSEPGLPVERTEVVLDADGLRDSTAEVRSASDETVPGTRKLPQEVSLPSGDERRLLILGAKDEGSCRQRAADLVEYVERQRSGDARVLLNRIIHTSGQRRNLYERVVAFPVPAAGDMDQIVHILKTQSTPLSRPAGGRVGLVFTGQGSQWHGMGRELIDSYPVFKNTLQQADGRLRELGAEWSILEELSRNAPSRHFDEPDFAIPAGVVLQLCLVSLLRAWGVVPRAITSHSSGESAAAYACGIVDFRTAIDIAYHYGRLVGDKNLVGHGRSAMTVVGLDGERARRYLQDSAGDGEAVIACVNSPQNVTVSGDVAAIEAIEAAATRDKVFARRLDVPMGYHSPCVRPIETPFRESLRETFATVEPRVRHAVPLFSSPTLGSRIFHDGQIANAEHWVQSMLQPVRFMDAFVDMLMDDADPHGLGVDLLIEVGPHRSLQSPIKQILDLPDFFGVEIPYHSCLTRGRNAQHCMIDLAASLAQAGFTLDMEEINFPRGKEPHMLPLDDLPYERPEIDIRRLSQSLQDSARSETQTSIVYPSKDIINNDGREPDSQSSTTQVKKDVDVPKPARRPVKNLCCRLVWAPDISFNPLASQNVLAAQPSYNDHTHETTLSADLVRVCIYFLQRALDELTAVDADRLSPLHTKYYHWMQSRCQLLAPDPSGSGSTPRSLENPIERRRLIELISQTDQIGKQICVVGPQLAAVLRGEVQVTEIPDASPSMSTVPHPESVTQHLTAHAALHLHRLLHKNPHARILEVGGKDRDTSRVMLETVSKSAGFSTAVYHLVNSSRDVVDQARRTLDTWGDVLVCDQFDADKDPEMHGFEPEAYDAIIVSDSLYTTQDGSPTVENIRKLLKAGGTLLHLDLAQVQLTHTFVYGLFPRWWTDLESPLDLNIRSDNLALDGLISQEPLRAINADIHDSGYADTQAVRRMISTKPTLESGMNTSENTVLVTSKKASPPAAWLASLQLSLHEEGFLSVACDIDSIDSTSEDHRGKVFVFLMQSDQSLLANLILKTAQTLRFVASVCKGLIWVSRGGVVQPRFPEQSLALGFLRCWRNEYVGGQYVSVDLDPDAPVWSDTGVTSIARVCKVNFVNSENITLADPPLYDLEYAERGGNMLIPRLYPDTARHHPSLPSKDTLSPTLTTESRSFAAEVSYLIVTDTFGLLPQLVMRWMASRGARSFVVLSDRGVRDDIEATVGAVLGETGCTSKVLRCDPSDYAESYQALQHCPETGVSPIGGVVQISTLQSPPRLASDEATTLLSTAIKTIENLERYFRNSATDLFLILSPLIGITGAADQPILAAMANYQHAIAQRRVSQGMVAAALSVGAVDLATDSHIVPSPASFLVQLGHKPLSVDDLFSLLDRSLFGSDPYPVIAGLNLSPGSHWDPDGPSPLGRDPRFAALRPRSSFHPPASVNGRAGEKQGKRDILKDFITRAAQAGSKESADQLIRKAIRLEIGSWTDGRFGTSPSSGDEADDPGTQIDFAKGLGEYGGDSLMAVRIRDLLDTARVSSFDILQSGSLEAVVRKAVENLGF